MLPNAVKMLVNFFLTNTAEEIKDYISNLLEFLEGLIKRIVPAAKDTVGYSCP